VSPDAFVEYFKQMAPQQKGMVYQDIRRELADQQSDLLTADDPIAPAAPLPVHRERILQVAKSYLVTEDDQGGILIIDQHALHERMMFEQLRNRVLGQNKSLESQRLLMPVVVDANEKRQALLETLRPLLEKIGIEVEPIGPDAVAIQSFASFLFDRKVEPGEFFTDLLDRAESGDLDLPPSNLTPQASSLPLEAVLHKVLDMMACKAAVKAGDQMGEQELAELLKKRDEVERASNCPHGRPTTLRLTLKDLEKQFGRT